MVYFVRKSFILVILLSTLILIFIVRELDDIRQESNAICYNGNTEGLNVDHDIKKKVQSFTRERISKINADDRKDVKLLTKSSGTTASEKHKVEMVHSSNESEHSEKHMWRFYETLRLKTTNTSITFVLLITYGRSGSSWLGDMISQAGSTLYVFEPLQRTASQGFFKDNLVCFNSNTCR
ncbi:uncharacterized protein LOC128550669 [Mercenaria mercenaria]|uniref:uncharacterized protein LOC128550669 n=1 Tax=Mercenaria mercenaria TaxID=6596 RepID=UPI00234EB751|nr:uncharacterized protein LOC128550669 [Mercenaria mercenaria]